MAGVRHHQDGRLGEAEARYEEVLKLQPSHPDGLHLLGLIAHQTGRDERAMELIGRAIAVNPDVALYHNNMGAALRALARNDEAADHYRRAVALDPGHADAHCNLGNVLADTDDSAGAAASYERALALNPDDADAHTGLATVRMALDEAPRAAAHFRRAVELEPDSALAHNNLGNYHLGEGDHEAALESFRVAAGLDPSDVAALFNFGSALRHAFRSDEAEPVLRRALALDAGHVRAMHMLGLVLKDHDRFDDSEGMFRRAIAADPNNAEIYNDLGNLYRNAGRLDDAVKAFGQALERNPDYDVARSNRSLVRLTVGDFAAGWRDYLARLTVRDVLDDLSRRTLAADLAGRRILLLMDQGLGDEIFFLRFAAELARRGAVIVYRADPKIAGMVERLPFIDRLAEPGDRTGDFDLCLSVGDLPYLLGMGSADDIPPPIELHPLADLDGRMRDVLAGFGPPPYIGATWRAGVQRRNRLSKVAPMEAIATALRPVAATVIALQRAPQDGELAAFGRLVGREIHDLTALNDDLESMLALVGHLDDYVCVSNTNVHLMTSRGRTCRVLVPYPPDYRWMYDGAETPWFPGTLVYRETRESGWEDAMRGLAADLAASLAARG